MEKIEFIEIAKQLGAEIKEVQRFCKYQRFHAKNIFEFCCQKDNRDYSWNLGSAGGPVISCKGAPPVSIGSHDVMENGEKIIVMEYAPRSPICPYNIDNGEILGWSIKLSNDE